MGIAEMERAGAPAGGDTETSPMIMVRRIGDVPSKGDGSRVLVDRTWPRGLSTQAAALDDWIIRVAPSTALHGWYAHDPARFEVFVHRYRVELADRVRAVLVQRLVRLAGRGRLTLLTAAPALDTSAAAVLFHELVEQAGGYSPRWVARGPAMGRPRASPTPR